jgi:hypothetical protein
MPQIDFGKIRFHRGSHLPMVMKALELTTGPVLELGCGFYSTPVLHWYCFRTNRKLLSCETDPLWYRYAKDAERGNHQVQFASDYSAFDLTGPWSVVLIDNEPAERRIEEVKRVLDAEYVIVHDSNGVWEKKYHYGNVYPLFKYTYKYRRANPYTTVMSNFHELSAFRHP